MFLFLFRVFFAIGFLPKIIFSYEASFIRIHNSVLVVVAISANHIFVGCDRFNCIWHLIRSWLGISSHNLFSNSDHFVQFGQSTGNFILF